MIRVACFLAESILSVTFGAVLPFYIACAASVTTSLLVLEAVYLLDRRRA